MARILDLDVILPGLDGALARHGTMDRATFLEVLGEAAASPAALNADEVAFAVSAGVPAQVLEPGAVSQAEITVGMSQAVAAVHVVRASLTTGEVAEATATSPSNVRRMLAKGDLYAAGRARNGETVFPVWQFVDGRPIPGLRGVIAAFPAYYHPLDVERVMTSPLEELDETTPVEWLATGGSPTPIIDYVSSLGLT